MYILIVISDVVHARIYDRYWYEPHMNDRLGLYNVAVIGYTITQLIITHV